MIYEKIKKITGDKKVSIAHLEREIGVSNGSISKWSNSIPNALTLTKAAKYLGTTVEDLLKEECEGK